MHTQRHLPGHGTTLTVCAEDQTKSTMLQFLDILILVLLLISCDNTAHNSKRESCSEFAAKTARDGWSGEMRAEMFETAFYACERERVRETQQACECDCPVVTEDAMKVEKVETAP